MASLHIVIGYDGQGNGARPSPVYVGRSGSEARAAMEKSDAARFELFSGIVGIRKSNPRVRKQEGEGSKAPPESEGHAEERGRGRPRRSE